MKLIRFNMHPLELSLPPSAVNHSLRGKRKVSRKMDGSCPSAECTGTNFR